jgi:hypothetical protein
MASVARLRGCRYEPERRPSENTGNRSQSITIYRATLGSNEHVQTQAGSRPHSCHHVSPIFSHKLFERDHQDRDEYDRDTQEKDDIEGGYLKIPHSETTEASDGRENPERGQHKRRVRSCSNNCRTCA